MEIKGKLGLKDELAEEAIKAFFSETSQKFFPKYETTKIPKDVDRYRQIKDSLFSALAHEKCLSDIDSSSSNSGTDGSTNSSISAMKAEFLTFRETATRVGAQLDAFCAIPEEAASDKKIRLSQFLGFFEAVVSLAGANRGLFSRWLSLKVQGLLDLFAALTSNKDGCLTNNTTTIHFVKEIKSALSFALQDTHLFENEDSAVIKSSFKTILALTPKCINQIISSAAAAAASVAAPLQTTEIVGLQTELTVNK